MKSACYIEVLHFSHILDKARNKIFDNVEKKGKRYTAEYLVTIDTILHLYVEAMHDQKRK